MTRALALVGLLLPMAVWQPGAQSPPSMNVANQQSALQRMRDTVNAGDARGYASVYADAAVITIHGTATIRGRASIEQYERELMTEFPGARFAFYEIWLSGGRHVAAHYGVNATVAGGRAMGHEGLLFFEFDESGVIVREDRFLDSLTPMAQLGALPRVQARPLPGLPATASTWISTGATFERRNEAVARRLLASMATQESSAWSKLFAERPTIDELMFPGPFADVRDWSTEVVSALTSQRYVVNSSLAAGTYVLVEGTLTATLAKELGPIRPARAPLTAHRAYMFEMDGGGRVQLLRAFMNGKEIAESLGQWPIK